MLPNRNRLSASNGRKRTAIRNFIERIKNLDFEKPELATSGLWDIKVEKTYLTVYHVTATHPQRKEVIDFVDDDPERVPWKLVGQQVPIIGFTWDNPSGGSSVE